MEVVVNDLFGRPSERIIIDGKQRYLRCILLNAYEVSNPIPAVQFIIKESLLMVKFSELYNVCTERFGKGNFCISMSYIVFDKDEIF